MLLIEWDRLPKEMQNDKVRKYYDMLQRKKFQMVIKRIFDFLFASVLLLLLSPVLVVLAIWIKCDSDGPAFYRQERVTQYGRIFRIYKFRTMAVDKKGTGSSVTVENDSRITKVGKKIRKLRLDELPQLINILKGEMSFVGTRPEVKKYVDAYSEEMLATLLLPAGVTSLASIHYKDEDAIISSFLQNGENIDCIYIEKVLPSKMEYNLKEIENFNLWSEIKIMLDTVFEVFL